jgi:MFS family permease
VGGRRLHDHLCGLGVGGGLVDRYGRRGALLIGLAVFGCATAVRGIVDSAGALIAVRAVMGGAALLLAAMLSIISSLCIDRESGPGDWARGDDRTRVGGLTAATRVHRMRRRRCRSRRSVRQR